MPQPNVVFIIADQHRGDFLGGYDNGTTLTPNLDRLADDGVAFNQAFCTAPLCSPSREALASGRYGVSTGCFTNLHELPPGTPTFVSQLRQAGYRTCAVGKTHMEIHAYDSDLCSYRHREFMDSLGWDETIEVSGNGMLKTGICCAYSQFLRERGMFDSALAFYKDSWAYFMDANSGADPDFTCHEWPFDECYQEGHFIAQTTMDWLTQNTTNAPFFLHVGFAGPHSPIEPLPQYMDLYRDRSEPVPRAADCTPQILNARRGYRGMITQIDNYVGRIRDQLDRLGVLDNTIIMYTADHGEMAGDHGLDGKCCFFEPAVHIPMIMAGPGIERQTRSDALVELIDLGRTTCDLCGVATHRLDQGHSLAPLLAGQTHAHRDTVYAEMGCDRMIRDDRFKLMWGDPQSDTRQLGRLHLDKPVNIPPSPPRLYDLREDPYEIHDLFKAPGQSQAVGHMLGKLATRMVEHVQPQPNKSRGLYRPL